MKNAPIHEGQVHYLTSEGDRTATRNSSDYASVLGLKTIGMTAADSAFQPCLVPIDGVTA